jgi:mRNA interferase RelE/StbE
MAYTISWSPKSKEDMRSLDSETARRIIRKVIELELAPYHFVEKLTDVKCWKLRVGDYRALLDIDEQKKLIVVLKVGHRKNVYK